MGCCSQTFSGFAPYIDYESRYGHRASSREARRRGHTHVERQRNCFARRGYDTSEPTALLEQFQEMLTLHILDRESAP
jgi:hypothetical protein